MTMGVSHMAHQELHPLLRGQLRALEVVAPTPSSYSCSWKVTAVRSRATLSALSGGRGEGPWADSLVCQPLPDGAGTWDTGPLRDWGGRLRVTVIFQAFRPDGTPDLLWPNGGDAPSGAALEKACEVLDTWDLSDGQSLRRLLDATLLGVNPPPHPPPPVPQQQVRQGRQQPRHLVHEQTLPPPEPETVEEEVWPAAHAPQPLQAAPARKAPVATQTVPSARVAESKMAEPSQENLQPTNDARRLQDLCGVDAKRAIDAALRLPRGRKPAVETIGQASRDMRKAEDKRWVRDALTSGSSSSSSSSANSTASGIAASSVASGTAKAEASPLPRPALEAGVSPPATALQASAPQAAAAATRSAAGRSTPAVPRTEGVAAPGGAAGAGTAAGSGQAESAESGGLEGRPLLRRYKPLPVEYANPVIVEDTQDLDMATPVDQGHQGKPAGAGSEAASAAATAAADRGGGVTVRKRLRPVQDLEVPKGLAACAERVSRRPA